ncbi:helix-turn-helix domain-containing protein [Pseudonocardia endophytica]|uniref:Transcriptional regulator with XRE-family HTH domain n=1 Tax=Pseudonocardia endophytica TaxID=401976 RepID=A0A4R1I6Q5_PSEEN|nr:helix-turn-helix transcriptional regulator [Pseudonocardia endophytica]TCK25772.1 transcriptional regulator with XRE-family HTH domain [Pseudonocardia endophytica]
MDTAKDVKDFLTTRRAKITPEMAGLPPGGRRRVPGLRREEVALLAGVSAEYYVQIERGQVSGVSDEVLQAVAGVLQLDDVETTHLFDLCRAASSRRGRARGGTQASRVPEYVQALMDAMVTAPAIVQNGRLDILGANALGRAIYAPVLEAPSANIARFVFLDERAPDTFPAWETTADDAVALLRMEAARTPHSRAVASLVGALSTRSDQFARRWANHDVRAHRRGTKRFGHPVVGELTLRFEGLEITSAPGLVLVGYTAEPASPSEEALRLLSSWAAAEPLA